MNAAFVSALLGSLLLFGLTAWVLLGWGSMVTRVFRMSFPGSQQTFNQLWLGWAVALLLLQLINFVAPVNWLVTALVAVGGMLAWWFNGRTFPSLSLAPLALAYSLILLLTAGWIAIQSMQLPAVYDTGLYHLQTIRWINEYAIVPGLGNLHGRFAFNQSFFAFAAALNGYPFLRHGYALANGFLILLLAAECWHALFFRRGERSLARFAAIFILPVLAYTVLRLSPASPSPDTASSVLQFLIWLHFARCIEERSPLQTGRARTHFIFILAATAITVKLSNLVFVGVIGVILLVRAWFAERQSLPLRLIFLLRLSWLPLLLLLVWVGRSYFLSGYPVYPSTFGGITVDWAIPPERVEAEAHSISQWARYGRSVEPESAWAWVGPWLRALPSAGMRTVVGYPVAITLLLYAAYGMVRWALRRGRIQPIQQVHPPQDDPPRPPPYGILTLPIFLGLIFWWLTAPDPRFVRSLLWLLPVIMAHLLLMALAQAQWGRPRLNGAIAFLIVNLAILATFAAYWPQALAIAPGFAPLPRPKLAAQTLQPALTVWTPVEDDRCWDAELPCTPYIVPFLQLRAEDLRHGFRMASPYRESISLDSLHHKGLLQSIRDH
ncbi:MAG: hypothetical protein IT328_13885 [Caldilineaceae bacterium]|nr:hypothetical protein [Caldilineaceae bacterium]